MKKIIVLLTALLLSIVFLVSCDSSDTRSLNSNIQDNLQIVEEKKYYQGTDIETFESITGIPLTMTSGSGNAYHYYCGTSNATANTQFLIYVAYLETQCGFEYTTEKDFIKQGLAEFKTPNGKIGLLYGNMSAKEYGVPEDGYGVAVIILDD